MVTVDIIKAGKLRVGIGVGAAPIAFKDAASGDLRGPAVDLGRALAARIGVEIVFVEYPRPGAVMEGVHSNAWDVAFLANEPVRAAMIDFTAPYVLIEGTYMVPLHSPLETIADVDRSGVRIAVARGSA